MMSGSLWKILTYREKLLVPVYRAQEIMSTTLAEVICKPDPWKGLQQ